MKTWHRLFTIISILMLATMLSPAQHSCWDIIGNASDTVSAHRIDSVSNGYLYTMIDSAHRPIPLDSIAELVFHTESYSVTGALIGVAVGAPVGGFIGSGTTGRHGISDIDRNIQAGVVGAVIGATVGSTIGAILGSSTTRQYMPKKMTIEGIRLAIKREQN